MHLEDSTKLYATTLYYLVLRILGMDATHALAVKARERLLSLGEIPRSNTEQIFHSPWDQSSRMREGDAKLEQEVQSVYLNGGNTG